ncbi:MAG: DUF742 domain-containing protein [Pseudonocardiaceae bacterium]
MSKSSRDDGEEQSFAGLVNDLSGGPWRSGGRRKRSARSSATPQPPAVEQQRPAQQQQSTSAAAGPFKWSRPAASASVVRPYTWTGGRTTPVIDLAVETLVSTSEHGHDVAVLTSAEHRAVAELCSDPRSVAEVAALLSLPLGVVRVLLADMADIGLVVVHRSANGSSNMPDMALMERVLSGLRRL